MAKRHEVHHPFCEECETPLQRTETSFASVWRCVECGFTVDDDDEQPMTPIKRKKRFIE